ncbi:MAG: polyketide synthase dehydratase domain-containing protein, partial [Verrucomicrobia bacterium]|nr:polyketide synthase dehydratase domain-containing protein [Verrucomicrobiota bacterium]
MFEFVGRVDQQVKIRGFRVELGEIESHLNRLPGVAQSAVVLKMDAANHPALIAFYVPTGPGVDALSPAAIEEQLKRVLPAYMIPVRFTALAKLPLTPNFKVDRKCLSEASFSEILERFAFVQAVAESPKSPPSLAIAVEAVRDELCGLAARILELDKSEVWPLRPMAEMGFDSIRFTSLSVELTRLIDVNIDPTLFYQYKTLDGLAEFLVRHHPEQLAKKFDARPLAPRPDPAEVLPGPMPRPAGPISENSLVAAELLPSRRPASNPATAEPIAIIGMDARLPGAEDIQAFWENLVSGRDAIREFSWDRAGHEMPSSGPKVWGGFIDHVDKFDAPFFGISPREAAAMDPRQRLFLETAWRAIENAGYRPGDLSGTNTGVFVGIVGGSEYAHGEADESSADSAGQILLGAAPSLIANRVSYHLNLRGPSAPIDTACSSSLVALHRAVAALQAGQCDLAVAGGVNLMLDPAINDRLAKTGMLSPDGRCKTFDSRADGYVRGEGVIALLLKPLSKAQSSRDPIYAVIRGSAENHGGRAAGLTVPNPEAQSEVVAMALQRAGVDPATVTYIEAHGTGTQLGDPIEVNGLKMAFQKARGRDVSHPARTGYCGLGSVKTNIGHLEAAAGLAGVVKVILAMRHGEIPANLQFQSQNPKIQLKESPFFIVDRNLPWTRLQDGAGQQLPRRAGVSSFGFSGANAHVVIEEYPSEMIAEATGTGEEPVLIVLSARTKDRLRVLAANLAAHLKSLPDANHSLRDLAYTLQVGREAMAERIAFVAPDPEQARTKLERFAHDPESALLYGQVQETSPSRALLEGEPGTAFLRALGAQRDWPRLGKLWVSGLDFDWNLVYGTTKPCRVWLPAYAFDRRRYWLAKRPDAGQPQTLGPLLDGRAPTRDAGTIFVKRFAPADRVLADHQLGGRPVLPGVASLEMARAAAEALEPGQPVRLQSVVWLRPLESAQAGEVWVRLSRQSGPGQTRFTVETGHGGEPRVHTQGLLSYVSGPAREEVIDLRRIRARCLKKVEHPDIYERFTRAGVNYGPYFRSLGCLWIGAGEALGELLLPPSCAGELSRYTLHPSLLDGALQAAAALALATDPVEPRIPFSVESVEILTSLGTENWVHVLRGAETELRLTDSQGRVAVKLTGFQTRRVKDPAPATGRPVVTTGASQGASGALPASPEQLPDKSSRSVLPGVVDRIEAISASDLGLSAELARSEYRAIEQLEHLGRLTLLQRLQDQGVFGIRKEPVSRASLRQTVRVVPKYYRLCDSLVSFLKRGALIEETGDDLQGEPKFVESPATQRALATLTLEWERYGREFPTYLPHSTLLRRCIAALPEVLSGQVPATDVMFAEGALDLITGIYEGTGLMNYFNRLAAAAVRGFVAARLGQAGTATVRVLEIGAGSGATTRFVADALRQFAGRIEYHYTDISPAFRRHGERHFSAQYPFMRFAVLDIEKPIAAQGFRPESFDLVLGANVIHTTRSLRRSLQTSKALLARHGIIVLLEGTEARILNGLTYGLLEGWWLIEDSERRIENAPLLRLEQWRTVLKEEGYVGVHALGTPSAERLTQVVLVGETDHVVSRDVVGSAPPAEPPAGSSTRFSGAAAVGEAPGEVATRSPGADPRRVLTDKVVAVVREVLQTESDELRTEATFESLGVDSIFSVEIIEKLNARLPVKLRSTDLFNYPTIAALANRLMELLTDEARGQLLAEASQNGELTSGLTTSMRPATPVVLETAKIPQAQVVERRSPSEDLDAIAVIGVSGQFPDAANLDQFWTNLREGRDA